MIIEPTGGLGNYMRTVFSYYSKCIKNNEKLTIIWKITDEMNGFFLDYFEPIDNIIFLQENNGLKVDYKGCYMAKGYEPDYSQLKLKPYLQKKITEYKNTLNNKYISVHIRRTDHIQLARSKNAFTEDSFFITFIKQNPTLPLYIATDNRDTQEIFKNLFPNQIKIMNIIENLNVRRKTSLEQAIIDIYMCVYSMRFRGSSYSSFTNLIQKIRQIL